MGPTSARTGQSQSGPTRHTCGRHTCWVPCLIDSRRGQLAFLASPWTLCAASALSLNEVSSSPGPCIYFFSCCGDCIQHIQYTPQSSPPGQSIGMEKGMSRPPLGAGGAIRGLGGYCGSTTTTRAESVGWRVLGPPSPRPAGRTSTLPRAWPSCLWKRSTGIATPMSGQPGASKTFHPTRMEGHASPDLMGPGASAPPQNIWAQRREEPPPI